ncbi:MAG: DUF4091 domain-containing protein [Spirochaetales bacterium]|nr:DUF4091 domain-containing protein [Spirochaetales bacterium]
MAQFDFYFTDALEKVFPETPPLPLEENTLCGLKGEKLPVQLAFRQTDSSPSSRGQEFRVSVSGFPGPVSLRTVELMPSEYPCTPKRDQFYLKTDPGLFPDLLQPSDGTIVPMDGQFRSLWIDFDSSSVEPGVYEVNIKVSAEKAIRTGNGLTLQGVSGEDREMVLSLEVLSDRLPPQRLLHTEWFHADCLAEYYEVPVFSESHWDIIEKFISFASESCGINTLLTPVFTPPLDTEVGGERKTVQLIDVELKQGGYSFDFSKLERWCGICRSNGISHLEISHFFTQWGAEFTPKIMAQTEEGEKQIFGWHVKADSPEYRAFLKALMPGLLNCLAGAGYGRYSLFFHVSDEPEEEQLESYLKAKAQIEDLLEGYTVIDALSSYEFYKKGVVSHPVPANDAIEPFLENSVPELWTYYCVAQGRDVPNRFFSMPSARNRIMGVLMYLHRIRGFLHWGYNFYNTQFSRAPLDPFRSTDSGRAFPSGDPFLVYPGKKGTPLSSIRNEVQMQGLQDLRVLEYLEERIGREETLGLVLGDESSIFTFTDYPRSISYFSELRKRIHDKLKSI